MAERQETSVMVSIQEILRDAQSREEQEKADADLRLREAEQQRLDDVRRRQDEENARVRADEEERQRRAFEDQKRQAELSALQEVAVQRARAEAEAKARLAEIASRQDHERQLHALSQDKHKKRLQLVAVSLGLFFLVGAVGAGVAIKSAIDKANAAEARAHQLETDKDAVEQRQAELQTKLASATDPAEIERVKSELRAAQASLKDVTARINETRGHAPAVAPGGGGGGGGGGQVKPPPPSRPCNCTPGDPLCSCL